MHLNRFLKPALHFTAWAAILLPIALLAGLGVHAAGAAQCGGAILCSCGDSLISDRTLTANDPVVNTKEPCTGTGLFIRGSGITLDCNGLTMKGSGGRYGVWILGDSSSVLNCGIVEFGTGIKAGGIGGNTIAGNAIRDVKYGIVAARRDPLGEGGGNLLTGNIVVNALRTGISTSGNENEISGDDEFTGNSVYDSNLAFYIRGNTYTLTFAKALITRNAKPGVGKIGFRLFGNGADVENCYASGFQTGFFVSMRAPRPDVDFEGSTFISNTAEGNGRDGFSGTIHGSTFDTNFATANGRSGILLRGGTEALPNSITGNQSVGNGENGIFVLGPWNDGAQGGGNLGLGNVGPFQCRIGGFDCE